MPVALSGTTGLVSLPRSLLALRPVLLLPLLSVLSPLGRAAPVLALVTELTSLLVTLPVALALAPCLAPVARRWPGVPAGVAPLGARESLWRRSLRWRAAGLSLLSLLSLLALVALLRASPALVAVRVALVTTGTLLVAPAARFGPLLAAATVLLPALRALLAPSAHLSATPRFGRSGSSTPSLPLRLRRVVLAAVAPLGLSAMTLSLVWLVLVGLSRS